MSGAISGISQALSIRNAHVEASVQVAAAKKTLEATEGVGESVVQLLEQVGEVIQQGGSAGQKIDVRA